VSCFSPQICFENYASCDQAAYEAVVCRSEHVQNALSAMRSKSPDDYASIMVDCSHGNSSKNHLNQPKVAADLAEQIAAGETGIVGIMWVQARK
jgi:phospho-2-dehydro-3-deoxyheptonate aldolase